MLLDSSDRLAFEWDPISSFRGAQPLFDRAAQLLEEVTEAVVVNRSSPALTDERGQVLNEPTFEAFRNVVQDCMRKSDEAAQVVHVRALCSEVRDAVELWSNFRAWQGG